MKLSTTSLLLFQAYVALATKFYVSTTGSDENGGRSPRDSFRTLTKAQEAVRHVATHRMSEDVSVYVAKGDYTIDEPLVFDAADSGKNGHKIKWIGDNCTISGGLKVEGWTEGEGGIFTASVPEGTQSRNLFVNGQAAQYARRRLDDRDDFNYTDTGMTWEDPIYDWLMDTPGIETAEVRFIASFTDRISPIESVRERELVMVQNQWSNQIIGWDHVRSPYHDSGVYVQNALGLLTDGGEYYLDSEEGTVYYKPLDGEDLDQVDTYLGIQEVLLVIGGTYDEPAHDISFEGFKFAHTTWMFPAKYGYPDQQTGSFIGEDVVYPEHEASRPRWWQTPSAVQISAANNIDIKRCIAHQLGAGGIGIGNDADAHMSEVGLGASDISITESYFTQVMGGSITAGGIKQDAHHPSDPRMTNSGIKISNNIFFNNSALISSNVNILVTYIQNSEISHNDVYSAPYGGINHGFGWGANDAGGNENYRKRGLYKYQPVFQVPTVSRNNLIKGNLIHAYGLLHTDNGALYSLSCSPGTLYIDNYGYDSEYKGLHPDEGSSNMTYINNLLFNDGLWYDPNEQSIYHRTGNNSFIDNWGKNPHPTNPLDGFPNHDGPFNNTFVRNKIAESVSLTNLRAQRTAWRAGIPPALRAGRPVSNDPGLADGFVTISRCDKTLSVRLTNFDDEKFQSVSFNVQIGGKRPRPLKVPKSVPADSSAAATYKLESRKETEVSVTVKYMNKRTGMSRELSKTSTV